MNLPVSTMQIGVTLIRTPIIEPWPKGRHRVPRLAGWDSWLVLAGAP